MDTNKEGEKHEEIKKAGGIKRKDGTVWVRKEEKRAAMTILSYIVCTLQLLKTS